MIEPEDIANGGMPIYLASPYGAFKSGLIEAHRQIAMLSGRLIARRVLIFSPIVHSHAAATESGIDPMAADFWLETYRPFAAIAPALIVAGMDGWRESVGIGIELSWFREAGKPAFLMDPKTLQCQPMS